MVVKEITLDFNEINWHDCIVKSIEIDRTNPGKIDSIRFLVIFPDSDSHELLVFDNLYWARLNLNFGIVADESILRALEKSIDSEEVKVLVTAWNKQIEIESLVSYCFDFNSSGSNILLIKKGVGVKKIVTIN